MIMKNGKQVGFIYKNGKKIDKIIKHGKVYFEQGFIREKTSVTLPINFDGISKDLKDYKIYGNTKQQILPDGYTQVDYIESNGNQHIDTGVYGNLNTLLEIKASRTTLDNTNKQLAGSLGNTYSITINIGPGNTTRFGTKSYSMRAHDYITADKPSIFICNKSGITIDGNSTGNFNEDTNFTTESTLYLMGANGSSTKFPGKLYYTKIYDNNVLIRYFIPCYRNSDNVIGLYDLVNNAFYENQGTGSFTYGSIAPTPDAPINMVNCGDRTKNLLPTNVNDWEQGTIDATTGETQESTTRIRTKKYYEIENDKDYYISLENNGYGFVNIILYDSNKSYLGQYYSIDSSINGAINLKINIPSSTISNIKYYRATLRKSSNSATITAEEISTIKPMIALGDTKLDFEPYGYKIPVNVRSDNLFDKDNANIYGGYINGNGYVSGSGTGTSDTIVYIECESNTTYTLKKMLQSDTENNRFRIGCTSEIPTRNMQTTNFFKYNDGTTETQYIYTTSSTAKYLLFYCGAASSTTTREQILNSIQIVKGSTVPSEYISYYNQTTNIYLEEPLKKINGYNDYIDFKNKKVIRNIGKIVLNGTENWFGYRGQSDQYLYRVFGSSGSLIFANTGAEMMSNYFKQNINAVNNANDNGIYCLTNNILYMSIDKKLLDDTEPASLKKFLLQQYNANKPVIVYYVLATPIEENIELPNIPTINRNNTLNIETEVTPSQVYIKYKSNN